MPPQLAEIIAAQQNLKQQKASAAAASAAAEDGVGVVALAAVQQARTSGENLTRSFPFCRCTVRSEGGGEPHHEFPLLVSKGGGGCSC